MKGGFQFKNKILYNLKQRSQFHIPSSQTDFSGAESIQFFGPKIWELMPGGKAIKQWKPTFCHFRLCKQYFYGTGFLRQDFLFYQLYFEQH